MAENTTPTSPLTLLDAVNVLLRSVGLAPIASLQQADSNDAAAKALDTINDTVREAQGEEWEYNQEREYAIDPGEDDGTITLPTNAYSVQMAGSTMGLDLVQRGNQLYDRQNHTFDIGQTVYVNLVLAFPFETIPPAIRWYFVVKAARRWATSRVPTSASYQFTKVDEDEALRRALEEDSRVANRTLSEQNSHFQRMRRR